MNSKIIAVFTAVLLVLGIGMAGVDAKSWSNAKPIQAVKFMESPWVATQAPHGIWIYPDLTNDGRVDLADLGQFLSQYGNNCNPKKQECKADFNQDGKINQQDLYILLGFYGQQVKGGVWVNPDFTNDGVVDQQDLAMLLSNIGSKNKAFDLNQDGIVNENDVKIVQGFYGMKI